MARGVEITKFAVGSRSQRANDLKDVGEPPEIWHTRRDELLDKVEHRDLDIIDHDLSIRLAVPRSCCKVLKVSRDRALH